MILWTQGGKVRLFSLLRAVAKSNPVSLRWGGLASPLHLQFHAWVFCIHTSLFFSAFQMPERQQRLWCSQEPCFCVLLCPHPPATQPTQGVPHFQTAWCVLPKGQHRACTHPPGPSCYHRWLDTFYLLSADSIPSNPGHLSFFPVSNPIPHSH